MNEVRAGYKPTELGEIPFEWSIKTLGELGEFYKGKGIAKKDISDSGYPCVLYGQLYTTYKENINDVSTFTEIKVKNPTIGHKNDLLIPSSGETASDIATASALKVDDVYIGGDINLYRPNEEINNSYLSYQINSIRKNELANIAQGSSVYHLYAPSLKKFQVIVPPLREQQKIAEILSTVDEQIENTEKLIEKTKNLKKSLTQKLFTKGVGSTKFKQSELGEIPVDWSIHSLGELGEIVKGKGIAKKDITESGHQCILYGQLYTTYNEIINTVKFYTNKEIKNPTIGHKNDLLIPSSGETANDIAIASALNVDNVYIGGDIILFRPKNNSLISSFLSYQINSVQKSELAKLAQGSSVYHLYPSSLIKFKVAVASIEEQQKIVSILTSVDEQINSYKQEKEKYLKLKKGLMQQLLTGKSRVTV